MTSASQTSPELSPELSSEAAAILAGLQKRHRVSLSPLAIREHRLQILQLDDLESLIGGLDPFADVEKFPFWVKIWEAAVVLADFMASQPPVEDGRVLELGAGLGLPGLAAAAAGHRVVLSDYEEQIIDFQRVSAAACGVTPQVEHLLLDWLAPPADLPRFTTIIGAEVLFREDFFQPLLTIFRQCLAPGGTIYLAHDFTRKSLPAFLALAEADFEIAMSRRRMRGDGKEHTIMLTRLTRHP